MQPNQIKEVSVRDVILTIHRFVLEVFRRWPWVILGVALLGGFQAFMASQRPVTFEAVTTFVINEDQGGGGGLGSVLGQFGFGGGGGGGYRNPDRIVAFASSQQLLNRMLLDTVVINEKPDLLINHLIVADELEEKFEMQTAFGATRLSANTIDALSRGERLLLQNVYAYLTIHPDRPVTTANNIITDMLSITANTQDEDLSLYFSKGLYENIANFYRQESTGQAQASVNRLEVKADSLLQELNSAEYRLATFNDTRRSLANQRDQLKIVQLNRQIQVLSLAYAEVVRNLETAKFTLSASTPFFQLISVPYKPLIKRKGNPLKAGLKWGAIGGLLAAIIVVMVRIYREIMGYVES
ncbi:MAG: hypothetical protein AAF840_06030 [Bacteroidota bacterium]